MEADGFFLMFKKIFFYLSLSLFFKGSCFFFFFPLSRFGSIHEMLIKCYQMLIWESQFPLSSYPYWLVLIHIHPQLWITYIHNCGLFTSREECALLSYLLFLLCCQSHSSLLRHLPHLPLWPGSIWYPRIYLTMCRTGHSMETYCWPWRDILQENFHLRSFDRLISPPTPPYFRIVRGPFFHSLSKWPPLTCPEAIYLF